MQPEKALRRMKWFFWNGLFVWIAATVTLVVAMRVLNEACDTNRQNAALDEAIQRTEHDINSMLAEGCVKRSHCLPIVQAQQAGDRCRDQIVGELKAQIRERHRAVPPGPVRAERYPAT